MRQILVSVHGNSLDVVPTLVVIDTVTGTAQEAPYWLPPGFQRYMGLGISGRRIHILAVTFDDRTSLVTVDRATDEVDLSPLPGVLDGHSVVAVESELYAVSSGTDELVRFPLSDGRAQTGRQTAWRASDAGRDTHHINSVLRQSNGNMLVSGFGETPTCSKADARDGYIFDVTDNRPVVTGIHHPHSVTERRGLLYYCESGRGRFCSEKGSIISLDGYVRGVCWLSDDLVCIGTSAGRAADRRGHYEADDCAVWIVDVNTGTVVTRIPVKEFGPEIYDIVLL
ncbi:DUF4915 domain-containing protein [Streptomyces scabiei]|uniref:DUF4915 domain-containing protein n=1 Tax=Streptomyces scabiei TaxID=1930 RepID=UPI000765CCB5|nr:MULTISPECIES: DUF4915 domain-containing protein [Streptomyces]MBP5862114.1 DUF4915 domain-containing protein [Streptomyces sp. LBUM 1484]MBP5901229.1 DUF4915 domain-containing protein [Streptomyces sp. LBUM 1488]